MTYDETVKQFGLPAEDTLLLSKEQFAAIKNFASENGRSWKAELRSAWETGNYAASKDANVLQAIRNQFGPAWLVKFNLAPDQPHPGPCLHAIGAVVFAEPADTPCGWKFKSIMGNERVWLLQRVLDRKPLPKPLMLVALYQGTGGHKITRANIDWTTSGLKPTAKSKS